MSYFKVKNKNNPSLSLQNVTHYFKHYSKNIQYLFADGICNCLI